MQSVDAGFAGGRTCGAVSPAKADAELWNRVTRCQHRPSFQPTTQECVPVLMILMAAEARLHSFTRRIITVAMTSGPVKGTVGSGKGVSGHCSLPHLVLILLTQHSFPVTASSLISSLSSPCCSCGMRAAVIPVRFGTAFQSTAVGFCSLLIISGKI